MIFKGGKISRIYQWLLELFFPVFCVCCNTEGVWLCSFCESLSFIDPRTAASRSVVSLDTVVSMLPLSQPGMKELLHRYKYDCVSDIEHYIARYIEHYFMLYPHCFFHVPDVIMAVPLHKKRLVDRGFNQSVFIASIVGSQLHLSVVEGVLSRVKHTPQLATLSRVERFAHVKQAFMVCDTFHDYVGKHILLNDDVFTTGATMEACADVLLSAGAKSVCGLTVFKSGAEDVLS